jgi:RNA polymerase sigma-70 factor (ECF subfamily)
MDALAKAQEVPSGPVLDHLAGLVEDMRLGNEGALEALYEATVAKLYGLASAIVRRVEDAEEVVCATYAHAWANAGRYDRERATVLGWLLMLCRSRALDVLRQRRANADRVRELPLEDLPDESARPDDLLSLVQTESRVHAALASLSAERRDLVSLAFLQGLSHAEIAEHTGMPLGTVKSHLRRALLQLRAHLEGP